MNKNEVLILGLPSGEHIIGEVQQEENMYLVTDPILIVSEPDQNNKRMRMAFIPYMPYAAGGVVVPVFSTVLASPTSEMLDHYNKQFSKIITPPTDIIL